jgi:hypothetical protein
MFKNKTLVIVVAVVLVAALAGGGYFLFGKAKSPIQEEQSMDETIQKLSPEDIGLTITPDSDGKKVKFAIEKLSGISSVEYELTYEADSTAAEQSEGGEPRVQRGVTGESAIESGKSSYESPWLDLGSCSKNVCRYDKGVKSLTLTLKVVKGGKTYSVEKVLEL